MAAAREPVDPLATNFVHNRDVNSSKLATEYRAHTAGFPEREFGAFPISGPPGENLADSAACPEPA